MSKALLTNDDLTFGGIFTPQSWTQCSNRGVLLDRWFLFYGDIDYKYHNTAWGNPSCPSLPLEPSESSLIEERIFITDSIREAKRLGETIKQLFGTSGAFYNEWSNNILVARSDTTGERSNAIIIYNEAVIVIGFELKQRLIDEDIWEIIDTAIHKFEESRK